MKLITPFTILNQNFHEMDLIRDAMKNRRLEIERLHDDYRENVQKLPICLDNQKEIGFQLETLHSITH